jgi:probable HAF family extracellular repeat protein
MRNLGTLGGGANDVSEAFALNNSRQVVGYSTNLSINTIHRAFVWDQTNGMKYLWDLLSNQTNWSSLSHARAIDNNGNIVGEGVYIPDGGNYHAYLLTPDAPHTADFGGRQPDNSPFVPHGLLVPAQGAAYSPVVQDGLLVAIQPAPAQAVAFEDSTTASAAPSLTLDQFWVREQGVPSSEWWEWIGPDPF